MNNQLDSSTAVPQRLANHLGETPASTTDQTPVGNGAPAVSLEPVSGLLSNMAISEANRPNRPPDGVPIPQLEQLTFENILKVETFVTAYDLDHKAMPVRKFISGEKRTIIHNTMNARRPAGWETWESQPLDWIFSTLKKLFTSGGNGSVGDPLRNIRALCEALSVDDLTTLHLLAIQIQREYPEGECAALPPDQHKLLVGRIIDKQTWRWH